MNWFSSARYIRHFQRYREIIGTFIRHGFGFAIDQLEPEWRSLRRILRLPEEHKNEEPIEDLAIHFRLALEELGPTFIKVGQILATRPDLLPPVYIIELSKLQDTVPPVAWEKIREVLVQEMESEPEKVFAHIDPEPLAAASLAQVHAATLSNGDEVVIKVQRPNITEVIDTDLDILSSLAKRAQTTRLGKLYDFVAIADDFGYTLKSELDYVREGNNADRFRENFTEEKYVYVPRVYWEFSSGRVLVLERIFGIKIDDFSALDEAGYNRERIAKRSTRLIIKEIFEDGFFQADPHPGNLIVMPGEVIGAMDFGMVGYLSNQDRHELMRLFIVTMALDAEGIVEQLIRMGATDAAIDRRGLVRDINRLLQKYYALPLKSLDARVIFEEILPVSYEYQLQLPSDLWLLGKTLAMMEGLGKRLAPELNVFAIAEPYVQRLMWQMVKPKSEWVRSALLSGATWSELFNRLPNVGNKVLTHIEQNDPININLDVRECISAKLDRMITRLALSVLVASLIIGLSFLVPATAAYSWVQWILVGGLVGTVILGIWLFISIVRTNL